MRFYEPNEYTVHVYTKWEARAIYLLVAVIAGFIGFILW